MSGLLSSLLRLCGHRVTVSVLGVGLLLNGLFMCIGPPLWWSLIPGIDESGPRNNHFVRDVGLAMSTAAVGLLWSVRGGTWRVALVGALFVCAHSALHVIETVAGLHRSYLLQEIATVHAPAWLAFGIALVQWSQETVKQ
jgi:hypothetical protein